MKISIGTTTLDATGAPQTDAPHPDPAAIRRVLETILEFERMLGDFTRHVEVLKVSFPLNMKPYKHLGINFEIVFNWEGKKIEFGIDLQQAARPVAQRFVHRSHEENALELISLSSRKLIEHQTDMTRSASELLSMVTAFSQKAHGVAVCRS